jgi:hypothetical protein
LLKSLNKPLKIHYVSRYEICDKLVRRVMEILTSLEVLSFFLLVKLFSANTGQQPSISKKQETRQRKKLP